MPLDVEYVLVHGVVRPRKCLVHPELTMSRVLGTKVGGGVVFTTFPLIVISQPFSDGLISS